MYLLNFAAGTDMDFGDIDFSVSSSSLRFDFRVIDLFLHTHEQNICIETYNMDYTILR